MTSLYCAHTCCRWQFEESHFSPTQMSPGDAGRSASSKSSFRCRRALAGRSRAGVTQLRSNTMQFVLISATAALGGLLFGYDTGVISSALLFIRKAFNLSAGGQSIVA